MSDTVLLTPVAARAKLRPPSRRSRRVPEGHSLGGFLAVPRELLFSHHFAPEHLVALLKVMACARWERTEVEVDGRCYSVALDVGEALISERDFPVMYLGYAKEEMEAGRSFLRRLLGKAAKLGIVAERLATDPRGGPGSGPRRDPPPTIVRFLKWRAQTWPKSIETDPPPDPRAVANATPYNLGTLHLQHGVGDLLRGGESPPRAQPLPPDVRSIKRALEKRIERKLDDVPEAIMQDVVRRIRERVLASSHEDVLASLVRAAQRDPQTQSFAFLAEFDGIDAATIAALRGIDVGVANEGIAPMSDDVGASGTG